MAYNNLEHPFIELEVNDNVVYMVQISGNRLSRYNVHKNVLIKCKYSKVRTVQPKHNSVQICII